ncbi:MAG: DUF2203 domain-containing protein [Thaumarchaeota archaeon]|nr:DUF2203 domain-containing protein [Nitrososphaerota archaeon]
MVVSFAVGRNLSESSSIREASHITAFDFQDKHLFTPQEASKLLPDIKPKVKELIERKKVLKGLHQEMERYNLLGFKTAEVAEKAAQLDALVEGMTKKMAELEDLGVMVKDLDFGLIDFPAERYGENVLLCWRYGESDVSFWHKPSEGYNGRKPLRIQLIQP